MEIDQVHKKFLCFDYYRVGDIAKVDAFGVTLWGRVGAMWKIFPDRA